MTHSNSTSASLDFGELRGYPLYTEIAQRYQIRSIPTLIMFKGGAEIARQAGALSQAELVVWISRHL